MHLGLVLQQPIFAGQLWYMEDARKKTLTLKYSKRAESWENESVDRGFLCCFYVEQIREENLSVCVTICVSCSISEFHEICMKYSMFEPSPHSPTGQQQGPSSPHELTWTPTHTWTRTDIMWRPRLALMNVCPSQSITATGEWYGVNEDRRREREKRRHEGKKKSCGQRWMQEGWRKGVEKSEKQQFLSCNTPQKAVSKNGCV